MWPRDWSSDVCSSDLSRLSKAGVVLITAALAQDVGIEKGLSGHLTARRYAGGEPGEEVPVGLVLAEIGRASCRDRVCIERACRYRSKKEEESSTVYRC